MTVPGAPLAGVPCGFSRREAPSSGACRCAPKPQPRAGVPAQQRRRAASVVAPAPPQHAYGDEALQAVRMARKEPDFRWNEVRYINCYALFMAYLLMAVRGLGYLVITWSTVVLLGGFVSDLGKKDFWSLTIITLVLTPRVSADVGLKEKLRYIRHSFHGINGVIFCTLIRGNAASILLAVIVWLCHLLVAPIVVCPLAALYICGPLISAGISMWRLIQHDYDNGKKEDGCCSCKDEDSHLQPALIVLYSLAVLQGLLFSYRFYSFFARKRLVNNVAKAYNMSDDEKLVKAVKEYLRETVTGCEKDPAFYKERNLATYAVEMIVSESSSESFLSGARILDALLKHTMDLEELKAEPEDLLLKQALAAELIRMASSSHVLEKLLQALDCISPHNERTGMRELAANIMGHLAGRTRVMHFPEVIQRIGSLIDISQQQFDFEVDGAENYRRLLMGKGFDMLQKLAADQETCRAISNSQGLLSKVVAPLSSDLLHPNDHEASSTSIVAKSLQVVSLLVATPGETGALLRSQISSDKEAIEGMGRIRSCRGCSEHVGKLTDQILTQLGMGIDEESLRVNKMLLGDILGRG